MRRFLAGILSIFFLAAAPHAFARNEVESIGFGSLYRPNCYVPMLVNVSVEKSGTYQIRVVQEDLEDRKSTRLNSSHSQISYAVFCLKKKQTLSPSCLNTSTPFYPLGSQPLVVPSLYCRRTHSPRRHLASVRRTSSARCGSLPHMRAR